MKAERSLLIQSLSWKNLGENSGLAGSAMADPLTDIALLSAHSLQAPRFASMLHVT